MSFLVGTLGEDLPNQDGAGEAMVGKLLSIYGEKG